MAQISETLYKQIADAYASIEVSLSGISSNAETALHAIVDVDTLDYPTSCDPDADAALEIELALLQIFNLAYVSSSNIQNSTSSLLNAVIAVNNYVITNTSGSDTSTIKLKTWVLTTMASYWDGGVCPIGWRNISEDAGYDVTGWIA